MFWDSEEEKTIDTTGQVNNNIVLQLERDVDYFGTGITIMLLIICIVKGFELFYFIYKEHNKKLKKRYTPNQASV